MMSIKIPVGSTRCTIEQINGVITGDKQKALTLTGWEAFYDFIVKVMNSLPYVNIQSNKDILSEMVKNNSELTPENIWGNLVELFENIKNKEVRHFHFSIATEASTLKLGLIYDDNSKSHYSSLIEFDNNEINANQLDAIIVSYLKPDEGRADGDYHLNQDYIRSSKRGVFFTQESKDLYAYNLKLKEMLTSLNKNPQDMSYNNQIFLFDSISILLKEGGSMGVINKNHPLLESSFEQFKSNCKMANDRDISNLACQSYENIDKLRWESVDKKINEMKELIALGLSNKSVNELEKIRETYSDFFKINNEVISTKFVIESTCDSKPILDCYFDTIHKINKLTSDPLKIFSINRLITPIFESGKYNNLLNINSTLNDNEQKELIKKVERFVADGENILSSMEHDESSSVIILRQHIAESKTVIAQHTQRLNNDKILNEALDRCFNFINNNHIKNKSIKNYPTENYLLKKSVLSHFFKKSLKNDKLKMMPEEIKDILPDNLRESFDNIITSSLCDKNINQHLILLSNLFFLNKINANNYSGLNETDDYNNKINSLNSLLNDLMDNLFFRIDDDEKIYGTDLGNELDKFFNILKKHQLKVNFLSRIEQEILKITKYSSGNNSTYDLSCSISNINDSFNKINSESPLDNLPSPSYIRFLIFMEHVMKLDETKREENKSGLLDLIDKFTKKTPKNTTLYVKPSNDLIKKIETSSFFSKLKNLILPF